MVEFPIFEQIIFSYYEIIFSKSTPCKTDILTFDWLFERTVKRIDQSHLGIPVLREGIERSLGSGYSQTERLNTGLSQLNGIAQAQ